MILNLTDLSDEPLQSQISRQIRAKILAGELTAGSDIPSIRKLAREQKVSVITVQRAYESLERQNLIHSRRGKGFFVSELSENTKREMAKQRLQEMMQSPVVSALAEGLSRDEIYEIVNRLLEENGEPNKGA